MTRELLQQVRLLDPLTDTDQVTDVLIEDGVITAIAPSLAPDAADSTPIITAQGCILAPGLVDLYSHSGEPGFESRETLASLKAAAAAGGFTRIAVLPDTDPPIDQPSQVTALQAQWSRSATANQPRLYPWGALTLGIKGEQLVEFAELANAGAVGFADGYPIQNPVLLRRLLEFLQPLGQPIALWSCDRTLSGDGTAREGLDSILFGLPGNPALSETVALTSILECVAAIGTPVHIMRVSTARSVELIHAARDRGLPITASTTWLHLLCNTGDLATYDPNLRLEPPLGTPADQQALIEGVKTGVIDAIAVDHSPYTYEEKTVAFNEAPPGAIGLELALPLLWQQLVESGTLSALELWRALSTNPANCLNQSPARAQVNAPAELVLFDPAKSWVVNAGTLRSQSSNTSWLNHTIQGQVQRIWTS